MYEDALEIIGYFERTFGQLKITDGCVCGLMAN
jgi:hypothetical protein